jgi:hypothetical protein
VSRDSLAHKDKTGFKMKKIAFVILFSFVLIQTSFAQISNTAWIGEGKLTLNGNELCSEKTSLTIHKGGDGWIWPIVANGCGVGWLSDYMAVQIVGSILKDKQGLVIGSVSDSLLQAKNFSSYDKGLEIIDLKFEMDSSESADISVKFKNKIRPGVFEYKAKFSRYRDSIWY